MKFVLFLLGTFSLCAFGGIVIPVTVPEVEHKTMQEDFPLARHVDYGPHNPVSAPTSVAVNLPMIEVLERDRAYGGIDVGETLLPYQSLPADDTLLAALDFDHDGEGVYWTVDGSGKISYRDTAQDTSWEWRIWGHVTLSEIATNPDSDYVWAYDACRGDLLRLHKRYPWCYTRFSFNRSMEITGLAVDDNAVYLLDTAGGTDVIYQFTMGRFSLEYADSWQILGFEDYAVTDLAPIPSGGFLIATTHPELPILLIEDKYEVLEPPVEPVSELALVETITLPDELKQPSGIWRNAAGHWFIVTDQTEVFELDENAQTVGAFNVSYQNVDCNQGCTEGITGTDNNLYVLTDFGYVAHYQRGSETFQYQQEFEVAYAGTGSDGDFRSFSGLSYRAASQSFFLLSDGEDGEEDILLEVDASFNELSRHNISYQGDIEGDLADYDAAGIQFYDGKIYVLSDLYNQLIEMSLDGEIQRTFAIDSEIMREPSDFFIHDGFVYMVGDHENDEPAPPLTVFALPQ